MERKNAWHAGFAKKYALPPPYRLLRKKEKTATDIPSSYILDMSRCVYCGYCEEVCPKEAIVMSAEYQGLAKRNRNNLRFSKEKLLRSEKSVKDRIEYIRGIYAKCNY